MSKLIIPLKELEYKDLPQVGGKAALLGVLTMQGFPVPDALIVTGDLYEALVQNCPEVKEIIQELKHTSVDLSHNHLVKIIQFFQEMELPEGFRNLLLNRLSLLHFPHFCTLAVRPSPVIYNAPTEIVSGLHHSVMNVENLAQLMQAIKIVWASTWGLQAFKFRCKNYIPHEHVNMAVIIQKMAKTEYSGNVLSQMPANPNQILINAGWGIPEAIVNGVVQHDTIILEQGPLDGDKLTINIAAEQIVPKPKMMVYRGQEKVIINTPPERVEAKILHPFEMELIAGYAKKIEEALGKPQTITWGREKNITLLEAFPIKSGKTSQELWTLLPDSSLENPTPMPLWNSIREKLTQNIIDQMSQEAFKRKNNFSKCTKQFLGRLYINLGTLTKLFANFKVPNSYTVKSLQGVSLYDETFSKSSDASLQTGIVDTLKINSWISRNEEKANKEAIRLKSFLDEIRQVSFKGADRKILAASFSRLTAELSKSEERYSLLSSVLLSLTVLRKINPYEDKSGLYSALPFMGDIFDTQYLSAFIKLVNAVCSESVVLDYFVKYAQSPVDKILEIKDTDFTIQLTDFMNRFGFLSIRPLEPSLLSFSESPSFLLKMLASLSGDDVVQKRMKNILIKIDSISDITLKYQSSGGFFGKIIPQTWSQKSICETIHKNVKISREMVQIQIELCKRLGDLLRELGQRIMESDIIEKAQDIFYLESDEVLKAASIKYTGFRINIPKRKSNQEVYRGYSIPKIFSSSGLDVVIPENSLNIFSGSVSCIPLGGGTTSGRVKKILDYEKLLEVDCDDILVIDSINFVVSPMLLKAAGVIIENADPFLTEHALCRILNIPAVTGAAGIMDLLNDGQVITIDGNKGLIILDTR